MPENSITSQAVHYQQRSCVCLFCWFDVVPQVKSTRERFRMLHVVPLWEVTRCIKVKRIPPDVNTFPGWFTESTSRRYM